MAKNTGILRFRRKVGEFVGAKGRNGENVIRKHVDTIYNPRTNAQLAQRIKIAPAQNFYAALAEILDHSWQGVKYGADSMSRFMSHALKMTEGFPYVTKGEKMPWPGKYTVASGGLTNLNYTIDAENGIILTDSDYHSIHTVGTLSTMLETMNPFLKDGDQLTFIVCYTVNDTPAYTFGRFFLDKSSNVQLTVSGDGGGTIDTMNGLVFSPAQNTTPVTVHLPEQTGYERVERTYIAGAVIVSRFPRKSNGAWQRSISRMKVTQAYEAIHMGPVQLQRAMDSYAVEENAPNSEYYLNGGSGETSGGSGSGTIVITLTSDNAAAESQLTGAGTYSRGDLVSVTAPQSTGTGLDTKTFSGWYEDGNFLSDATIYAFTASVNRTLQAQYTTNDEP